MSKSSSRRLPSMVAYWDKGLRCRFANEAYEMWFGVDPSSLIGKHLRDLLGAELFDRNERYIEGALSGNLQVFQRTLRTPDTTLHDSLAHYVPDLINGDVGGFTVQVTELPPASGVVLSERRQAVRRRESESAGTVPRFSRDQLLAARVRSALQGITTASGLLRRRQDIDSLNNCLAVIDDACIQIPEILSDVETGCAPLAILPPRRVGSESVYYSCENGHFGAQWGSDDQDQRRAVIRSHIFAVVREAPGRMGRGFVCGICGSPMEPRLNPSDD